MTFKIENNEGTIEIDYQPGVEQGEGVCFRQREDGSVVAEIDPQYATKLRAEVLAAVAELAEEKARDNEGLSIAAREGDNPETDAEQAYGLAARRLRAFALHLRGKFGDLPNGADALARLLREHAAATLESAAFARDVYGADDLLERAAEILKDEP